MVNSTITPSRQCNTTCQKIVSFRLTFGTDPLDCLGPKWAVFGSSGRGGVDVNRRGQVRVSSGRTPLAVTCHHQSPTGWSVMEQVRQKLSCGQQTNQYCLGGTPQWQLYMDQQTVNATFLAFGQESAESGRLGNQNWWNDKEDSCEKQRKVKEDLMRKVRFSSLRGRSLLESNRSKLRSTSEFDRNFWVWKTSIVIDY